MPVFPATAFKSERFQWPVPGRRLGGLNLRDGDVRVPWHQFTILRNVLTREGAPERRLGYGNFLTSALAAQAKSFMWFQKADDTTKWLAFAGTTAYNLAGDPGSGSSSDTTGGFANSNRKRGRQYGDTLYVVQGTTTIRTFDGTLWANMTPNAAGDNAIGQSYFTPKHIAAGFDRTWYAGSDQYTAYVWPSELGDPTYAKTTLAVKIDRVDGQDITGLIEWGRYILVPLERSLWAVPNKATTDTTFTQFRISADVGIPSGESFAGQNKVGYFLGNDKQVYRLYLGQIADDLKAEPVSQMIQTELDKLTSAQVASAEAVIFDDYYILAAGTRWFVLDLRTSDFAGNLEGLGAKWAIFEHPSFQSGLFVHPTRRELYSTDSTGQVNVHWSSRPDGGSTTTTYDTDAGTAIDWKWETAWFNSGHEERQNLFLQFFGDVAATVDSQTIKIEMDTEVSSGIKTYEVDCIGTGFLLGVSKLGVDKLGLSQFTIKLNQSPPSIGRRWRYRAYRYTDTKQTKVLALTVYYRRMNAPY